MSDRYVLILVLYALASFAAVLAICDAAMWLLRRQAIRAIGHLQPRDGVLAHLVFHYLPGAVALILTLLSAIPGYFRGEPVSTQERPGPWLVALAVLGAYALIAPMASVAWLAFRTTVRTNAWIRIALARYTFAGFALFDLDLASPVIVASGIFHKSIFLSKPVRSLLSQRELRAALRHEAAHCRQNHNFVKLLSALAPRLFTVRELQESFREMIEYAADDEACHVPGDALNLASAVVILARQTANSAGAMLDSALIETRQSASIERRVERLVLPKTDRKTSKIAQLAAGCVAIVAATAALALLDPAQHAFREALELLVR